MLHVGGILSEGHRMMALLIRIFVICWLLLPLAGWGSQLTTATNSIAVIVHPANQLVSLEVASIAKIYRGRELSWSSGDKILAINRPITSEVRKYFYHHVLNSKPSKQFFSKGSPIPFKTMVARSDLAAKRLVARIPHAISYVNLALVDDSVKVVYVFSPTQ